MERTRKVTKRVLKLRLSLAVAMMTLAVAAAGCGASDGNSSGSQSGSGDRTITIAGVPGWTADVGVLLVVKKTLEDNGYTVDYKEFSEPGPIYAAMARGDIDLTHTWLPQAHGAYWEKYKGELEIVATYHTNGVLQLAVPDYVDDVQSIADLPAHASEFGGKIIGIEPGSGSTKVTQDKVIPEYGLDDSFQLVTSSTPAMLAQVKKATDAHKPIVAAMWSPFWAMNAFNMRPLEDPKLSNGKPDRAQIPAPKGFSKEFSKVAEMLAHLKFSMDEMGTLERAMVEAKPGEEEQAVQSWLDENTDVVPSLEKYLQ